MAQDAQAGKTSPFALSPDFDYIKNAAGYFGKQCSAETGADLLNPVLQLEAFEVRACGLLLEASEALQSDMSGGDGADGEPAAASLQQALVRQGVLLGQLARAHCQLIILRRFHESVARQEERLQQGEGKDGGGDAVVVGQAEVRVLRQLVHLLALSIMETEMAEFRAQDYVSAAQAAMCSREVLRLCRLVRAEAVWCVLLLSCGGPPCWSSKDCRFTFTHTHIATAWSTPSSCPTPCCRPRSGAPTAASTRPSSTRCSRVL